MPLAAALAALCAVGIGAFATHRTAAGGLPSPPERASKTTPAPEIHSYLYTLHLDLSSLSKPTQVRIRFEDLDGLRTVDSRLRDPGAKFNVAARGKGETVTWRIYYGGTLVKTVAERSDGTQVDGGAS